MRRSLLLLSLAWCTAAAFAQAPALVDDNGRARLTAETAKLDSSANSVTLKGELADWSLADLGIEYKKPPTHRVTITRVRLGSWASRAGLAAGDIILQVDVDSNGYTITIDRNGKVYRARLSRLEGSKLAGKDTATTLTPKTSAWQLTSDVTHEKQHSPGLTRIEREDQIYTEVNLAICVPEPKDAFGKGQWLILGNERLYAMKQAWKDWLEALRTRLHEDWAKQVRASGNADMHVTMRNGAATEVSLIHDTPPGDFADQAVNYARSLRAPYPAGTQVSELHLEVKFSRKPVAAP